jgi:hypothetical protein
MDNETIMILTASLFIIRIIITVYCANKAENLNRNMFLWGLFGFIFPIIALIWIQFKKELKIQGISDQIYENKELADSKEDLKKSTDQIFFQKISLTDLKKQNLLSEIEYQEKMQKLQEKEQNLFTTKKEVEEKEKVEKYKFLIEKQIEPSVEKLKILFDTGIISKSEFDQKKAQTFAEKKDFFDKIPFPYTDFQKLKDWQKRSVRDYYRKSKGENIYLLKNIDNNVYSFSNEEFNKIIKLDNPRKYSYILLPANFDPNKIK